MRGIVKRFPGVQALKDVSLDVRRGEVHVLLGENGAGKSTLIKVLSGAYRPDAGEILFDGRPVHLRSPRDAQALGVSTIYQEFTLAPDMSVADNVFLGRERLRHPRLGIVDRPAQMRQTSELLSMLGLEVAPDTVVKRLGVAEQQMVEIAKALSFQARLIVMDEPTAVLSTQEIDRLFETIRQLQARGVAVVYISHRLDEVQALGRPRHDPPRRRGCRHRAGAGHANRGDDPHDGRPDLAEKYPKPHVTPGEEALRVERLSRDGVFEDVSFRVRRGEILGIAGLVGSRPHGNGARSLRRGPARCRPHSAARQGSRRRVAAPRNPARRGARP